MNTQLEPEKNSFPRQPPMEIVDRRFSDAWERYWRSGGTIATEGNPGFATPSESALAHQDKVAFPPPVFTESFIESLSSAALGLHKLVTSIPWRIFEGNFHRLLEFQGVTAAETQFFLKFCTPRLLEITTIFSRPDFLVTDDGFMMVEINMAPPIGGMHECDRYADNFSTSRFSEHLRAQSLGCHAPRVSEVWLTALHDICRVGSSVAEPVLFRAIADPSEDVSAIQYHADFLHVTENAGYRVVTGLIQALSISGSGVYFGTQRIHIIYTMFTFSEMRQFVSQDQVLALAGADEAGVVDFIAPPTCVFFDNKANLELLTSEQYSHYYSDAERELIRAHVPQTVRVTHMNSAQLIAARLELVLKPACEYGGQGVLFGDQVSASTWASAIESASKMAGSYVCQKKVPNLWRNRVPTNTGVDEYFVCLGPMLFGHRYAGTFLRQSLDCGLTPVINASNGAEVGTAFVGSAQTLPMTTPTTQCPNVTV